MQFFVPIAGALGALTLGAMSPGPSFVMVARISIGSSRRDGLAAALGMGVGGVLFTSLALVGLHALVTAAPKVYFWGRIAGAVYLMYLGFRIWLSAKSELNESYRVVVRTSVRTSFVRGLLTQLSNPKTAIFYGSVFAALLPSDLPLAVVLALPLLVFAIETGWYSLVAVALSSASPRQFYIGAKTFIDRTAGTIVTLLGLKLLVAVTAGS